MTVMRLNRKGKQTKFWNEQTIVVDDEFLRKDNPSEIKLDFSYTLGIYALEIYHNGERLANGITFEEIDSCTVKLNRTLYLGDEVYIRSWQQDLCCSGGGGYGELPNLEALEKEIRDSRVYVDKNYRTLGDRLDEIQNNLGQLYKVIGNINIKQPLMYKINVQYETDQDGNITLETVVGDFNYVKKYIYDEKGNLILEVGEYGGEEYQLKYTRDDNGYLVREQGRKLVVVPALPFYRLRLAVEDVDNIYRNDGNGNVTSIQAQNLNGVTTNFYYDAKGDLIKEVASLYGTKYEVSYEVSDDGFVLGKRGHFLTPVLTDCGIVYAPHFKESEFAVDRFGNIVEKVITGDFTYFKEYFYNFKGLVTEEVVRIEDEVTRKEFSYSSKDYISESFGHEVVEYPDILYVYHVLYAQFCQRIGLFLEGQEDEVVFVYDSYGNKVQEIHSNYTVNFEYDEKGLLLKEEAKYKGFSRIITYLYEGGKLARKKVEAVKLPIL